MRVRLDVTGYNSDTNSMNVTWHGTEGKLINTGGSSLEGRKSTIHGAAGLKELKHAVSKVYKFKKYSTISQWGIDLKGGVSASDDDSPADKNFHFDKKYEGRRKHLKDDIDFSSMIHQQTKKPIKYFGKKVGDERVWYEVDQRGGSVKLKEIQQKDKEDKNNKDLETTYEREMPINDFMMFAMEKDLRGYTQEDVDDANGGNEYPQNKDMKYIFDTVEPISQPKAAFGTGLFGLTWGNIQGLKGSFDLVTK